MEPLGAMSEGEWNSFSGMYYADEADFMAQLLGNCSFPNELPRSSSFDTPSMLWHGHESAVHMSEFEEGVMDSSDNTSTDMHSFSLGDGYGGGGSVFFSTSSHGSYLPSDFHQILLTNNSSMSMNFLNQDMHCGKMDESTGSLPETVQFGNSLQLKRESEILIPEPPSKDKNHHPLEKSKKRSWVSGEVQNKSNMRSKKNQKLVLISNNDGDNNARPKRQNSSSYGSEDESNASQEFIGGMTPSLSPKSASALNLNGKSRASRGSATDPQSLYARKRRERINERLRILQSLVPNGTKVDISTMLEEAVQYVKFLQLQIKLLSSDDLWMYSPIAYNGMDIGLDLKITTPR